MVSAQYVTRRRVPGVTFLKHPHPGEEIADVTEGSLEYKVEGTPPVTLVHPGWRDQLGKQRRQG